ncbi:MAG: S-layer homology domain-containing protein [Clostridiales bacterium]|nr:S-layer homology domain-containing protein [Clostridiales bacterium]
MKIFKMGRTVIAMLSLAMAAGIALIPQGRLLADAEIPISGDTFPDPVFRDYVENVIDKDHSTSLSEDEIAATKILCTEDFYEHLTPGVTGECKDLQGISYFTALEDLDCRAPVGELDLSKNTALVSLGVYNSSLSSLDLSANTKLKTLCCNNNDFKSLDTSNNTALERLECNDNGITSLDLSNNTNINTLNVSQNPLGTLDVSKCTALVTLYAFDSKLNALDVTNNPNLELLYLKTNNITSLDVSKNPKLYHLTVSDNPLTTLDISNCPYIVTAYQDGGEELYDEYTIRALEQDGKYIFFEHNGSLNIICPAKPTPTPTDTPTPTATATPTPEPKIEIQLNKNSANIVCGKSIELKVGLKVNGVVSNDPVKWVSSNSKIASVSQTGVVKAKMAGSALIAAVYNGKQAICKVQVLYKDVTKSNQYWYKPTNELTNRGIVQGYDKQTLFKPQNVCTRAQMVTFLWRLSGQPAPKKKTCTFKDVKSSAYYYNPVLWAVEKGITTGVSKTKFDPSGVCTRAQTVTFLWRMAGKPKPGASTCKFKDVKKNAYYFKAVIWASRQGIVAGYAGDLFKPQNQCTRAQMVTFLYKYDLKVNKK